MTPLFARRFLELSALFIIALHIWGAIAPSHDNWGVHVLGFFGPMTWTLVFAIIAAVTIPSTQRLIIQYAEEFSRFLAKRPLWVGFLLVAGVVAGGALLLPAKLHLLGDGAILLRSVPRTNWGDAVIQSFKNQPLMNVIYRWVMNLQSQDTMAHPYEVYMAIDLLAAGIFIVIIFWWLRSIQRSVLEKILMGCLIFFAAGSQFFFGYVENYVLQYVVTVAYVVAGWFALEGRIPIAIPVMLFILLPGLNLGSIVFLPSFLALILFKFWDRKLAAMGILGGLGLVGVGVLFAIGFDIKGFIHHFGEGNVDFLQPFTAIGGNFPYPIFSLAHALDWLNAHFLIIPFGLLIPIATISLLPHETRWRSPIFLFLIITTACGLFFTIVVNAALGMARDWDMLASFFIPLIVLDIYLLSQAPLAEQRKSILILLVAVTGIHWAAWIGINASEERHMQRMRMLDSPTLLSLAAQMAYNESLANYFFDTGQYAEAREYYEKYMKIDAVNPRIIANISDVYRKLGDKENYFETLKRAVALQNPNPGVYSNLGVEYASRGDTMKAIEFNEKAVAMDPRQQKAHANLGILYLAKRDYEKAERHFGAAIALGMREPVVYRYGGDASVYIGKYDMALQYYNTYLEMVPQDTRVREIRERVRVAARAPMKQ